MREWGNSELEECRPHRPFWCFVTIYNECLNHSLSIHCSMARRRFWMPGLHSQKQPIFIFKTSRVWPFLSNYRDSALFERRGMFPTLFISNATAYFSKLCSKRFMWEGLFYLCLLLLWYQSYLTPNKSCYLCHELCTPIPSTSTCIVCCRKAVLWWDDAYIIELLKVEHRELYTLSINCGVRHEELNTFIDDNYFLIPYD